MRPLATSLVCTCFYIFSRNELSCFLSLAQPAKLTTFYGQFTPPTRCNKTVASAFAVQIGVQSRQDCFQIFWTCSVAKLSVGCQQQSWVVANSIRTTNGVSTNFPFCGPHQNIGTNVKILQNRNYWKLPRVRFHVLYIVSHKKEPTCFRM